MFRPVKTLRARFLSGLTIRWVATNLHVTVIAVQMYPLATASCIDVRVPISANNLTYQ